MEMTNVLTIKTRSALRAWLSEYGEIKKECWVATSVKEQAGLLRYLDVVDEALCFGWIDSTKKKVDGQVFQRLSPRGRRSRWTELNKERVRRLRKLGLMTAEGEAVLPEMEVAAFVIDPIIEKRLKSEQLYQTFLTFPPLYQRIRIDTIQYYRNDLDLFEKRLTKLVEQTRANNMYGTWHDEGRLIDY
ncbi:YdeI/OmpD-associated family protein [Vagococcus sp. BWB3-3]|uniref:YdeI/OmpD-associated family protein n=1 Tax=Vagococcus allomyrinae TaxID=2794353 RepID=A0A940P8G8_9ENTE|nr:YdeI/OmpD-associated family protein [Vagococcus allomyrinae]MBP1043282.1 YdeI/OmpD-associated family protein [Vagococcus allomyrinae]